MKRPADCILIAGPTAAGKSAVAMAVAERYRGTVINADSMQVYAELRILTARPSLADEDRIPHRLFGGVPVQKPYSVGRFVVDARDAIAAVRDEGRLPIIVGGTGLYFKALLDGLSPVPPVATDIREKWRAAALDAADGELHKVLQSHDPAIAARLAPGDQQRIVRALEVLESSGRSLLEWHQQPGVPVVRDRDAKKLVMLPSRQDLRARAEQRFTTMMANGALAEAEAMARLKLNPDLPAMRAIGLGPLIAAGTGELSKPEAVQRAVFDTLQYIKRQTTWIRRNMITWNIVSETETESQIDKSMSFIQG